MLDSFKVGSSCDTHMDSCESSLIYFFSIYFFLDFESVKGEFVLQQCLDKKNET